MTIDERLEALTTNMELLQGMTKDLLAASQQQTEETKKQKERDRQYFAALAGLLNSWAGPAEEGGAQ